MNLIKPQRLKKGDTIGFLSAAGILEDKRLVENARKYFEEKGFSVKVSGNAFYKKNYLSGSDEARLEAVHEFFCDESIKAVIALRGGYGSLRLINKLNYDIIKKNPKIFGGYSDITALSLMIYKKTGLITFQSPMIYGDFGTEADSFTETSLFSVMENNIKKIPFLPQSKILYNGSAEGILWGGNLSTIASLCGVDFIPDEEFILMIEDIGEPVYKIDRMMTQLMNIEEFQKNLKGIILGNFTQTDSKIFLDDLFYEIGKQMCIPIKEGLQFGHEKQKLTVPVGVKCEFDTQMRFLSLGEDYLS